MYYYEIFPSSHELSFINYFCPTTERTFLITGCTRSLSLTLSEKMLNKFSLISQVTSFFSATKSITSCQTKFYQSYKERAGEQGHWHIENPVAAVFSRLGLIVGDAVTKPASLVAKGIGSRIPEIREQHLASEAKWTDLLSMAARSKGQYQRWE